MNKEEIKTLLTLQASIHQMLIISKDNLPSDEELFTSIIESVRFVHHKHDVTIDEQTFIMLCNLAVNVKETVENPDKYVMKMVKEML